MQRNRFLLILSTVLLFTLSGLHSAFAALPPVYVTPGKDETVTVPLNITLVLRVKNTERWTGETDNKEVATFKPSTAAGFYPGFTLHGPGTTIATVSDGENSYTFTIIVPEKK
jgi:hypothetical protein